MKLGYVCQYFTTEYRGPVTNLMSELSKSVDVVNYSCLDRHMQYYPGGVHSGEPQRLSERLMLRRYGVRFKASGLLFPRDLTGMISADRPDVVQSEEYYQPASRIAYDWAKANGVPFIFNHRASEVRDRTLRDRMFFAAANPLSRKLVRGSDAIVCLSQAGRKALCDVFPEAEEKVRVIPNSIDPLMYSGADGAGFRARYNIPYSAPLLLCVARLHPQKRIDLLVRAFAQVKRAHPKAVLCVVGPWFEAEKRRIDSLVGQLKVEDVVFAGPVPNESVKDAYAAADVVALSSEYEPFGYCLLEAMSLGKPAVAFGIGAVPEIVEQGVSGYHVPFPDVKAFGEKAAELLSDPALARRMGAKGLERVHERFSLGENAGRLLRLYSELSGK